MKKSLGAIAFVAAIIAACSPPQPTPAPMGGHSVAGAKDDSSGSCNYWANSTENCMISTKAECDAYPNSTWAVGGMCAK